MELTDNDLDEMIVLIESARNSYERRVAASRRSGERDLIAEVPYLLAQIDKCYTYISKLTTIKIKGKK